MFRAMLLAIPLVTLGLAISRAESPQDEMGSAWAKKWAEKNKEFFAARERAKAEVQATFEKAIDKVDRQKGLTPAARTDRRKELQAAQSTFGRSGKFPPDDEFAGVELDYFMKINKAATQVSLMIDEVIEKGSKTRNDALEKKGLKMKDEHEQQLGGASRFVEGSVWRGQLHRGGGNTIPYHLNVGKMGSGGLFKGHVEDNPGVQGNWNYDIEGQTRALGVQYKMTTNRRGNFTAVAVDGIVSGDRLIARIVSIAGKNGKPASAILVLKRVR